MSDADAELFGEGAARGVFLVGAVEDFAGGELQLVGDLHAVALDGEVAVADDDVAVADVLPQELRVLRVMRVE